MERFSNEIKQSAWLIKDGLTLGVTLIVRFKDCVYPSSATEMVLISEPPVGLGVVQVDGGDVTDCLVALLRRLGGRHQIRLEHKVTVGARTVDLDEEIRLHPPSGEDVEYRYRLTHEGEGDWKGWDVFTQESLLALSGEPSPFKCCANCALSELPRYGGVDDRHGLYCFRDDESRMDELRMEGDHTFWREVAHPDVNALHVCERHIRRVKPI